MKLLTYLVCVLMCLLNSTPILSENDDIADLNLDKKPEHTVFITTGHDDIVAKMVKSYVKSQLRHADIRVIDKLQTRTDGNYVLSLIGREKEDTFEITAVFSVTPPDITGTMPDDLEKVGMKIANQYVKFIESCEVFKERDKETAP